MNLALSRILGGRFASSTWNDAAPVREELFGVERLEQHAESLAAAQPITDRPPMVLPLRARLNDNASALLTAYRASAAALESGQGVAPAADWLLDNYHLVEEQIREIRDDLPPGYYRQLPKLAEGPFAGYPRVFGLAWAYVAHTDSHFDPDILRRFIEAYQRVQPLTIGELWAVAITLRIVLVENLRRLADQITAARAERADADAFAGRLLAAGGGGSALLADIATRSSEPLSELFASHLAKKLRDQDPKQNPVFDWLDERLRLQGSSIEEVVQHAQLRQGASNVSVRNVITSMRLISDIDWADLFESVSLVDETLAEGGGFAAMDFPTRNLYRSAIEQLARGSALSELEIAALATERAAAGAGRAADAGHHLIAGGRRAFEASIDFRPTPRLWFNRTGIRFGIGGYIGGVFAVAAVLIGTGLWTLAGAGAGAGWLALFAIAVLMPATEAATGIVNRVITWSFGATILPGLELAGGVPAEFRTLVAVPTLLTGEDDLIEQIERLEVHHLSDPGGDIVYALLTDGVDADTETVEGDAALIELAASSIARLNRRHGPAPSGRRFHLLNRRRVFDPAEGRWMGWERKRGKLHELNRLLRGATDTTFAAIAGEPPALPPDVRFVITLDADTRLPRDAALRLIGKMAHPLNRPTFDAAERRVVDGYAILQPRVTPSLPIGREGSLYQRVFSSPGGIDPYAAAVSDVYQDLFGEGSYTGKGIYDVDAFEAALEGRVPDHTMLSHDLFEGVFARAGLASDVEVVEDFPARYDVVARRQHRWTRGDWQLLPWMLGQVAGRSAVPAVGRAKMLDNLRRSTLAPTTLLAFALCWLAPPSVGVRATLVVLGLMAIPALLPILFDIIPRRAGVRLRSHVSALGSDIRIAATQMFLAVAFLPDQAFRMADAVIRTLHRVYVSRRHLLEWTTAAAMTASTRLDLRGFARTVAGGTALAMALVAVALLLAPTSWPVILPFAALWLAAPALALWASRSPSTAPRLALTGEEARELRLIARRTWRFFETFVTAADNYLPPDNFQESPKPVVARRTSPTNIGLYLLSAVTARDFGWAGAIETAERLEDTMQSIRSLPRFRGHLFNWYGTADLAALDPPYVSAVDSGNLAGHLIALANACEAWANAGPALPVRDGMKDHVDLARLAATADGGERERRLGTIFDEIDTLLVGAQEIAAMAPALLRLADKAAKAAGDAAPATGDDDRRSDVAFWIGALRRTVLAQERDRVEATEAPGDLPRRFRALAAAARELALGMDFAFLVDPERKLLSIGYAVADNRLDPSCYDLLASEARLASLFAIAKGDVSTRHWFRLGRTATPLGPGSALISWSGSMFEYLMPSLVMRAPAGSLLEQTNRLVVARQQAYGRSLGAPWGVSESAYNARDLEFTYQYSNFGVPGLGLKRGLSENAVIAPYATGLAAMADPKGALANYARLAAMGALGRFGFYEALDFTRSRVPEGEEFAIVRAFMAHHQGMTIVSIANTLQNGRMRARFHREPMIKACELLLQERMPRSVATAQPRAEEVKAAAAELAAAAPPLRRLPAWTAGAPITNLLSNGRYAVMLTAGGAGYSRWRDIAVTRWREDATRDDWGSFIYLKDIRSGLIWSAGARPAGGTGERDEVVFGEDHAAFIRHDGSLTTTTEVIVSGESDGEVRRVTLTNAGRAAREIELTSYAELALAAPASDNAHPAFAKMFVETEHLPEFGALIATRRPRSAGEPRAWAAHFAVVEGEIAAEPQHETDRARFLGRGRDVGTAEAIFGDRPLSNTVGTVLDPAFALRRLVRVPPGKRTRVAFWTLVAASREELLDLVDAHHDRSAFDRAKTLAWTQAQVQLRHLDVGPEEAADFQRLAAPILYADPAFRAAPETILRGAGPQSGLWSQGISGDLPIVLLRIDDVEDLAQVRQLLRAHEYWRIKRLAVDLVIVNERASSYVQDLQIAIETAVRTLQSRPRLGEEPAQGSAYALRADLMTAETRARLSSAARVVLVARRGPIADQIARLPAAPAALQPQRVKPPSPQPVEPSSSPIERELEFLNGTGGFAKDGREYVTVLRDGATTPAPWINVISNERFGFQVSATGSGYTWAQNSRENQITAWSNDPVSDPPGEALYIRDEATGELWTPTAQPIREAGLYVARHGFGYTRFEREAHGVAAELLQFTPLADPVKISRLTLKNTSGKPRRLSVTAYAEWVLGIARGASGPFVTTEIDLPTGALFARNPWGVAFQNPVAFSALAARPTSWTADRTEFLGRAGGPAAPAGLAGRTPLSGAVGAGLDPCAALQTVVEMDVGETVEIVWLLGQTASAEDARTLIERTRSADLDALLAEVTDDWARVLGAVQVKTPDRAMDIMLNGWLLYQAIGCRIRARSAFYQASGAYGFRDQLQDGMALAFALPSETRRHLLRVASRQFPEGDVQHWWLPHSGQGVRTRISDDRVWLAFAAATYVASSGDAAVLEESVPFLDGPPLGPGEHDAFFQPMVADESASLFEHCARGLDQCLALTGAHGLPLMGTGDWNDGMNRVGQGGAGESVWLGWLLVRTIALFAPHADARDPERAARWRAHAAAVTASIEREAWDGAWYRRATFDDGAWLGSSASEECRIDSIAQSWGVLSGAADPARARQAMGSVETHLIRPDDGVAVLFAPPFDKTAHDPGYIKGYPPGLRENGGQYSHAAMWSILAFAELGDATKAHDLFALLNPINHALTPEAVERYKVEPYVLAADVYSVAPHTGRGGWTWYTGSASWMYRAGVEGILGIRREGDMVVVDPRLPEGWPGFEATIKVEETEIAIRVIAGAVDSEAAAETGPVRIRLEGGRQERVIQPRPQTTAVMPGLDPGIHQSSARTLSCRGDGLPGQARQ